MLSRAHNYSLTSRSKYRNTLNSSTERAITTKQTNIKPNNTFQKTNAWKPSLTHANSRSNTSVFFPTKGFQWTGDMLHFKRQFSTEKLSNTQEPSHEADQKPPTENINALKNKTETFHRTLSIYAEEKNPEKALETFNVFTKEVLSLHSKVLLQLTTRCTIGRSATYRTIVSHDDWLVR
jgi:hypothetical protein